MFDIENQLHKQWLGITNVDPICNVHLLNIIIFIYIVLFTSSSYSSLQHII